MDKTNHHHHHRVVVSDGWPRIRGERDGSRGEGENPVEPMQSSTAAEVPDSRRESKKFSGKLFFFINSSSSPLLLSDL
ncbi:hypothetical protein HanRHA438_Chr15g0734631 [Helianthus annuus]|nr:hypothetical protein HanRHA438_Chr15g0734631 [Helianthus annuus]